MVEEVNAAMALAAFAARLFKKQNENVKLKDCIGHFYEGEIFTRLRRFYF